MGNATYALSMYLLNGPVCINLGDILRALSVNTGLP